MCSPNRAAAATAIATSKTKRGIAQTTMNDPTPLILQGASFWQTLPSPTQLLSPLPPTGSPPVHPSTHPSPASHPSHSPPPPPHPPPSLTPPTPPPPPPPPHPPTPTPHHHHPASTPPPPASKTPSLTPPHSPPAAVASCLLGPGSVGSAPAPAADGTEGHTNSKQQQQQQQQLCQ